MPVDPLPQYLPCTGLQDSLSWASDLLDRDSVKTITLHRKAVLDPSYECLLYSHCTPHKTLPCVCHSVCHDPNVKHNLGNYHDLGNRRTTKVRDPEPLLFHVWIAVQTTEAERMPEGLKLRTGGPEHSFPRARFCCKWFSRPIINRHCS